MRMRAGDYKRKMIKRRKRNPYAKELHVNTAYKHKAIPANKKKRYNRKKLNDKKSDIGL